MATSQLMTSDIIDHRTTALMLIQKSFRGQVVTLIPPSSTIQLLTAMVFLAHRMKLTAHLHVLCAQSDQACALIISQLIDMTHCLNMHLQNSYIHV